MARDNTGSDVPRGEGGKWLPGASPNPGGRKRTLVEIERMLDQEHRNPAMMRDVFARLKKLACGEVLEERTDDEGAVTLVMRGADPAFMKLYLERILGPVKDLEDADLRGAPPDVIEWLINN